MNPLEGNPDDTLDPRVRGALEFMRSNLHQHLLLSDIAAHVCLSPWYFAHLFRSQLGVSPKKALGRLRMESAVELLADGNTQVKAVSPRVGFEHTSGLVRKFRSIYGTTPKRHQAAHAQRDSGDD